MVRDKDYLRTRDGLLFNVIGYDHQAERVAANLKYVGDRKWNRGYREALCFLRDQFPDYCGDRISVPLSNVSETYLPQARMGQLIASSERNELEQAAVDLVHRCADTLAIPLGQFGITDSLLWGRGNRNSDIDLVVYGSPAARRALTDLPRLYRQPDFVKHTEATFTRQPGFVADDRGLTRVRRTFHKGLFQGIRFSLRAVREPEEIMLPHPVNVMGPTTVRAQVTNHDDSLFFPAIYVLDSGLRLVSFRTGYEGLFVPGDELHIRGVLEGGAESRIVIGSLRGHQDDVRQEGNRRFD